MKKILIVFLALFSSTLYAQEVFDLVVKVEGIKEPNGKIFIALFDSEENFLGKRLGGTNKEVDGESLILTFKNLKKGIYAVSIFHDVNENDQLDKNFMGIPTEPFAFSNNAKGMFGPPSFEECMFELLESTKVINITL